MTHEAEAHEARVRRFYDEGPGGEGAGAAYTQLMGTVWHHGQRGVEAAGGSPLEAAVAMQRHLVELAGLRPGQRALDFGSGPGGATVNMAKMTGALFVGVTNTYTLTRRAQRLAADDGVEGQVCFVTVGDHDYRTFPAWPDASFDAVTFYESVCHLPDQSAFFHAVARILKPGGRLVGLDWLRRPFGDCQTEAQIRAVTDPVCEAFRLADLGTLDGYAAMMRAAGLRVTDAVDEYAGQHCWGATDTRTEDRARWLNVAGGNGDLIARGKLALDAARAAGVFTVGWWAATKP